jgi:ankyrin repeat protein
MDLFDLVYKKKWNELETFINKINKTKQEFDFNIRDKYGNYIIQYIINNNQIDILKKLLENDIKIDILDNDNNSILNHPIKYNNQEIINIICEYDKKNIGISIFDYKDKGDKTLFHLAVVYNNLDILKILLKYYKNINIRDNNGYNILHLAIYNRNFEITEYILKNTNIKINDKINTGENALHIAINTQEDKITELLLDYDININEQDYSYDFTPLHYAINLGNKKIIKKLIKKGANINIQDIYGNTLLHYCIVEKNIEILDYIINLKIDTGYNLWNIDGNTPLHLLLMVNQENIINIDKNILIKFVENTNLNIPNNDGNTQLYYICLLDLWKNIKNILELKKLDISIFNKKEKKIIDLIKEKELFIDMVTKSYLNRLRKNKKTWNNEWENMCVRDLYLNKLSSEEKNIIIKEINKKKNINNKNELCYQIIYNKIINIIKQDGYVCGYKSYPLKKGYICLNVEEGQQVGICTFTGSTLDVLIGMIFLLKKHKNLCSTLGKNFISNICLKNNIKCDFNNFELIWTGYNLKYSDEFDNNFLNCLNNKKNKFIIIPIGIELDKGSHANYLIYDIENQELERYEPNGSSHPIDFDYNNDLLDDILKNKINKLVKNSKYISPKDYLPKISFQLLDSIERNKKKIGDPGGFCAVWSVWYVDFRITYASMKREKLIKNLIKTIKTNNISVKNMIRNYSQNIIDIRDKILKNSNADINQWLNDDLSDEKIKNIFKQINEEINNLL